MTFDDTPVVPSLIRFFTNITFVIVLANACAVSPDLGSVEEESKVISVIILNWKFDFNVFLWFLLDERGMFRLIFVQDGSFANFSTCISFGGLIFLFTGMIMNLEKMFGVGLLKVFEVHVDVLGDATEVSISADY